MEQMFSCEFCEIFKNNNFYRTLPGECFWTMKTPVEYATVFKKITEEHMFLRAY